MTLGDFSPQAAAYREARPHYPPQLVKRLITEVEISEGDPVVDIGAGTGIFTALLAQHGFSITAIEPSSDMRKHGELLPQTNWIEATFEKTTLDDASQAWAVAAQAFHWADVPRALPEIRRILKPGGSFTALWNNRLNERSDVLRWTMDAISRHVPEFDHHYRARDWKHELLSTGDFTEVIYHREEHAVWMSRQRFLNLWRSHNRLNTTAGPQRFAALMVEVEQHLTERCGDDVEIPYACEAWTAR